MVRDPNDAATSEPSDNKVQTLFTATLPMGTIDGMPVGMYIFAREGRDDVLLRVMAAWEIMIQNKARPAVKSRDAAWTDDHQSATTELSQA